MTLAWTAAVLLAVLAFAVIRPRGLPEATVAVPAAIVMILVGPLDPADAVAELRSIGPTIGFLAAVLILGYLCESEHVFTWVAAVCAAVRPYEGRGFALGVEAGASRMQGFVDHRPEWLVGADMHRRPRWL